MTIPPAVRVLERDLRAIFGARLESLLMYGSREGAASQLHETQTGHGGHAAEQSTHTLAIVSTLTVDDLNACARRASDWHQARLATPLILPAHELATSLDAFPLEFAGIAADFAVVAGRDPFDGRRVSTADLRRACEVQARSHLLHLREGFLETHGRGDRLAVLIVDSAPAFAALLTSIARLEGVESPDAGSVSRHAERTLELPRGIVSDVMRFAHVTEISSDEATKVFPAYLDAVERLVKFVDRWRAR